MGVFAHHFFTAHTWKLAFTLSKHCGNLCTLVHAQGRMVKGKRVIDISMGISAGLYLMFPNILLNFPKY